MKVRFLKPAQAALSGQLSARKGDPGAAMLRLSSVQVY